MNAAFDSHVLTNRIALSRTGYPSQYYPAKFRPIECLHSYRNLDEPPIKFSNSESLRTGTSRCIDIRKMADKRPWDVEDNDDAHKDTIAKPSKMLRIKKNEKRLIVVLENASLEAVKVGKNFELLNCDDHQSQMKRFKRDPALCRPDIAHQSLLMLLDSPLNRSGLLQIYIHTERNILIEIHPQTRIPRTLKRFSGLIVQLLHKFSIRSSEGNQKLLKVIKNPVSDHFPAGCKKYSTSFHAKKLVNPREIAAADEPIVVVIGAMAHGKVNPGYTEQDISISTHPLSAALTCAKICTAFEEVWGIQ